MLTASERQLLQRTFAQGPAALVEAEYDGEAARAFLARPDVQKEWVALQREFDRQEVVFGHTKFTLRRQLTRLGPGATAVLANALAGPQYARNDSGTILTDAKGHPILLSAEPTPTQVMAARDVLDRLDVIPSTRDDGVRTNINVLFVRDSAEKVNVEVDPTLETEEQRALSRERVRNVIARLHENLPALRTAAAEVLESKKNGSDKLKKQTKKAKKKVTKKAKKKVMKKKAVKKAKKKVTKKKQRRRAAAAAE